MRLYILQLKLRTDGSTRKPKFMKYQKIHRFNKAPKKGDEIPIQDSSVIKKLIVTEVSKDQQQKDWQIDRNQETTNVQVEILETKVDGDMTDTELNNFVSRNLLKPNFDSNDWIFVGTEFK